MRKSKITVPQYTDLLNKGWTKIAIAQEVGMSKQALYNWIRRNKELIDEHKENKDRDPEQVIAEKNNEIKKLKSDKKYWKGMYKNVIEQQEMDNPSEIEQLELENGRLLAEINSLKRKSRDKTIVLK